MDKTNILQTTGEEQPCRVYEIELTNRSLTTISGLRQFEKLRSLNLGYNLIQKIENLQHVCDLRQLHLESNAITRISGLQSNKNLRSINLAHNRIEKIEGITHISKLQKLILDHNLISKLGGIVQLKELKVLQVQHNKIQTVDALPAFSKLQTLILSHNAIKSIPPNMFASSSKLINLNLANNLLQSTLFLQNLNSLQILNLSNNRIKQLSIPCMPNLESLNLSDNQIQKLPAIGASFPELLAFNFSKNFICSEVEVLQALSDTNSLAELDFRQNPMHSQAFEGGLQKIHCFDFLNGKVMTKAGAKYYQQIDRIHQDLHQNSQIYDKDDEEDRQTKMSGFYDEELQYKMSGIKPHRVSSPNKKRKHFQKPTFYEDIDRSYHQFMENDRKIKAIREQYLKIYKTCNFPQAQTIITAIPQEQNIQINFGKGSEQLIKRQENENIFISQQLVNKQKELKREQQTNLNKWKELKQREKSFNIRDVRKSRGKEASGGLKGVPVSSGSNWRNSANSSSKAIALGKTQEKQCNELLKTQPFPHKKGDDSIKSFLRPSSMRRKE